TFCIGGINAQRFASHKVYLTNNGVGTRTVKVKPLKTFNIKKDNRMSWVKYKIGNGEVTFSATANTTTNNRNCYFVLVDNNGNPVDTLEVIQAGKVSTTSVKNASKAVRAALSTKSKTTSTVTRKSSTNSSRNSYGGQCTATTKKGRRCSRQATRGSAYCWQHK
ncbi:MAG: hypothetical protein IKI18_02375, partial [Prevotella sp.]|nr:hypothetical protein [Prevotella sp.]